MITTDRVRVGDVLRLQRREVQIDPDEEYRLIGVYSFGKGIFHRDPTPGADLGDYRFFRIEPGDLVLSNIQAWEGAIAFATAADAGTVGTHRFLAYVPVDSRIDPNWARWFFLSEPGMQRIRSAAPGTAVRNRTLAVKRFEDLVMPLPSLDRQVQEAAYLDDINARAAATSVAVTGRGAACAIDVLPAFVDEVVSRRAVGSARVGDLVELVSDIVHPGDSPGDADEFIGLQHIQSHTGRRLGSEGIDAMKGRKFRFRPGDLLYGYLRPYLNKVWVADRHGLCSVDQYVLRPRSAVEPDLLAHILRGRAVLDRAIELTHSLQLPRLRSGLLMSLDVPVVPTDQAAELVKKLDSVRDLVVELVGRRELQQRAADALVPAALNRVFGSR